MNWDVQSKESYAVLSGLQNLGQYNHTLKWVSGSDIPYVDYFTRNGAPIMENHRQLIGGITPNNVFGVSAMLLMMLNLTQIRKY